VNTVTELPALGKLATKDTGVPVRRSTDLTDLDVDFINPTWRGIPTGKDLTSYALSKPMQRGVMLLGCFCYEYIRFYRENMRGALNLKPTAEPVVISEFSGLGEAVVSRGAVKTSSKGCC